MNLSQCDRLLAELGHPVQRDAATSARRFPEGTPYRIEIPSCEGPQVLEEAAARAVPVHRVSQGSGVMIAPVYLKLGVRNAPNIYPSGRHLLPTAEALGRERVRGAQLVLRLLAEQDVDELGVSA